MIVALVVGTALAGSALSDAWYAVGGGSLELVADVRAIQVGFDAENVDAWSELGWARYFQGDFPGAVRAWEEVTSRQPDRRGIDFWLEISRYRSRHAPGPLPAAEVSTNAAGPSVLRLAAAGDTMLGNDLRGRLPPGDGESVLAAVAPWLAEADVAFLNVEGTLADGLPSTKCGPTSTHCYAFRTPTRYTAALTSAGIDVVSHANNHAMDLGEAGMRATAAALDEAKIAHAGRYGDTALLERGGHRVAFVAAHTGECCLNINRIQEVVQAVHDADAVADLVVLSFHGGAEGSSARHVPGRVEVAFGEQRGDVRAMARAAVDAGADLVLGHGPHVIRAMELYRGRLIAYSLGNFVGYRQFGTRGGVTGTSMLLEVELAANGVATGGRVRALRLDDSAVPHPDPSGAAWSQLTELAAADFPTTGVTVDDEGRLVFP